MFQYSTPIDALRSRDNAMNRIYDMLARGVSAELDYNPVTFINMNLTLKTAFLSFSWFKKKKKELVVDFAMTIS